MKGFLDTSLEDTVLGKDENFWIGFGHGGMVWSRVCFIQSMWNNPAGSVTEWTSAGLPA